MDPVHNMEHVPVADDGNVSLEEAYQHDGDVEAAVVGGIAAAAAAATTVPDTSLLRLIEHEDNEHYLEWLAFGAGKISALIWSIARRGVMGELWMRCVHASIFGWLQSGLLRAVCMGIGDTNPSIPLHRKLAISDISRWCIAHSYNMVLTLGR